VGHLLTFHEPLVPARREEMAAAIQSGKWGASELNPDGSYLTAWDPETSQVKVLAGAFPSESPGA
jgi:hypothetical protein